MRSVVVISAAIIPLVMLQVARGQAADPTPASTPAIPGAPAIVLPRVDVVGSSPLMGSGVPVDTVPAPVQVLTPQEINRTGVPSLTGALAAEVPTVRLSDLSGNPFQPDVLFRGFSASPVEGETQGLAVYVNGARFNTPFGDTVNWDLIPSNAVARVDVEGGNPLFGLNALGGSVAVKLKDGFNYHGGELIGYGGSYGRGAGLFQYGQQAGNSSAYIALEDIHDSGWRKTSNSEVRRVYGNLGWRTDKSEVHLSVIGADNSLGNPGATPVDLLSIDRGANSTAPNTVKNKYVSVNVSGDFQVSDETSIQALGYVSTLTQRLNNGNTLDFAPCTSSANLPDPNDPNPGNSLCEQDGATPVTGRDGSVTPSSINGANGYSGLSQQGIDSTAYGTSVQAVNEGTVFGRSNRLVVGASLDAGETSYNNVQFVGGLSADRVFLNPSYVIDQADLSFAPVSLRSYNQYYGLYYTDRFELTDAFAATVSGRFNLVDTAIHDRIGTQLTTKHQYSRFNPGVGVTYKVAPRVQLYANYSESNRAPTPNESECSNPDIPCQLPNAFISDPNLKQVIARTIEVGVRGRVTDVVGGRVTYDADFFHTENSDDLIFVSAHDTNAGGFYANAGRTLRQGLEATLKWRGPKLRVSVGYSYTEATYQTALDLNSANNPAADANGVIHVVPGNRLPGVPAHRGVATVDYDVTDRWTIGGSLIGNSSQFLFGDDANQTKRLGGFIVANVNTSYRITDHIQAFGLVDNVTDTKYSTFGTFAPVGLISSKFTNPRVYSPGAPVAGYGGLRVTF